MVTYPADRVLDHDEFVRLVVASLPQETPFVLVAESFSGPIAIDVAADRPEGLVGLVLCVTFPCNPLPLALRWLRLFTRLMRMQPPAFFVRRYMTGPEATDELVEESRTVQGDVDGAVLQDRMRQVFAIDVRSRLPEIECPVLCLVGRRDKLVGPRSRRAFESGLSDVTMVEIDAAHMMMHVHPRSVTEAIDRFVMSRFGVETQEASS